MLSKHSKNTLLLLALVLAATAAVVCWQKLFGRQEPSSIPVASGSPSVVSSARSATPGTAPAKVDNADGEVTNRPTDGPWRLLRDLEFARVGTRVLHLDLYLPRDANTGTPLVVWIHGGGWRKGTKDACKMVFLVKEGFAVASVEYRLAPEGVFPDPLYDCKAAVRFLRANAAQYGLDPNAIGVAGASSGGHLAALVGMTGDDAKWDGASGPQGVSSRVQAVCDFFGPTDLTTVAGTKWDNPKGAVYHLLGGTVAEHMQTARDASPIFHVAKGNPPFLILHGDSDQTVPLSESQNLTRAMQEQGVDVQLQILPGAGHGRAAFSTPEIHQRVARFFRESLKAPQ